MKRINKLLATSILSTVLLGAGALKVSADSNDILLFNSGNSIRGSGINKYDDGWYAQKAYRGEPVVMEQEIPERKAAASEWTEYRDNTYSYYENGKNSNVSSVTKYLTDPAYLAMNYSLVTSPEDVTIGGEGGYTTRQYYEVGGVFRYQKHPNTTGRSDFYYFVNGLATYGLQAVPKPGQTWDQYNSLSLIHKYYEVEDYDVSDIIASGFDYFSNDSSLDLEHRDVVMDMIEFEGGVSYEDWHKSFDNDETTLFGATSYNPNSHFIIRIPIIDNPLDNDLNDSFGITPSKEESAENGNYVYGDAVSNKDILAISQVQFTTWTSQPTGPKNDDAYGWRFGQSAQLFDTQAPKAAWDTKMDHAMELAFPEPEFTITPLGYNDRNQFEVDVLYDHVSIPTNYDIVSEITYTMMGPATKESTAEDPKVIWDEITITDQKVTREHRKSIDSPETVTDTIWTYGEEIPDELTQWIDGDKDNGGNVDLDENPISGAEEMFPDGYDGDMEIGATEKAHSVIKYDGLYYGDDLEDKGKEYEFSNTITLAPTDLGRDNAYLLAVPEGTSVTKTYGPWTYIIEPGSAAPILEHFEIIKPDSDSVDPLGTMELKYSGDSKSEVEDLGVGLKPSYLNKLQVLAVETDIDGNIIGEEIALTDLFSPTNIDENTGAFSGTVTTSDDVVLSANSHYRVSLRSFYGNEAMPENPEEDLLANLKVDYTKEGEYINISTDDFGDLDVVVSDNVVSYDETLNEATLTFNYSQAIPTNPDTGAPLGELEEFTNPEIASVEVVNHLGEENEAVIDTVDFSGVTLTDAPQEATITVASDKLSPNKTYDLSIRVKTVAGRTTSSIDTNEDVDFTTPATGAFEPEIGIVAPVNQVDVEGGVQTDFEFKFTQQLGDGIDLVETSESLVNNIAFSIVEKDADGNIIETLIDESSIEIPTEDSSTILITDGVNIYDTVTEYDYKVEVTYDTDKTVTREGKISFELNGFSELEEQDVVMTDISSTMTSLSFETEINDVEIAPGYDSFYVNKVEIVDETNKPVTANIKWYDEAGEVISEPVDTDEGVEFTGKFSAQLLNIKQGTDLSTYQLHIKTNSINESEDDPTPFKTDYYFNIFEMADKAGLVDLDGNFINSDDINKEFMDVKPVEVTGFIPEDVVVTEEDATFKVELNDELGVINDEEIILIDGNGNEYSIENGNLETKLISESKSTAGIKTYEFTISGLAGNTEYSNWSMKYEISENLGTEDEPLISSTTYVVEMDGVTFKTLESENPFPWWVIILLLLLTIIGVLAILGFLLWRKERVTKTTDISGNNVTFLINRNKESSFIKDIDNAKLVATQDEKEINLNYIASTNEDNIVSIKLENVVIGSPIKNLEFKLDRTTVDAENAKAKEQNKIVEDKYNADLKQYELELAKWTEEKEKASASETEFTAEKPKSPEKPKYIKMIKPAKNIKLLGSVKTVFEVKEVKEVKEANEVKETNESTETKEV